MEKKIYYYPQYVPTQLLLVGLYLSEWICLMGVFVVFLFAGSLFGLMLAIFIDPLIFLLLVRTKDSRRNKLSILIDYLIFMLKSRTIMARPREELTNNEN